jgi:hypothetical protein
MKVGTKSMATKCTVPSLEYELSKTDNEFEVVIVCSFRISMASNTIPTWQYLWRILKEKSDNPDFLHIRMTHRPD